MRYLSLILMVGLMWWSWSLANNPTVLSDETHLGIQEDLKRVISEYVQENLPNAKNFRFDHIWTETIKANEVKATFAYSFDEETDNTDGTADGATGQTARIGISGHAILDRTPGENSDYDVWSLNELYVLDNKVDFKEGLVIKGRSAAATEENAPESSH